MKRLKIYITFLLIGLISFSCTDAFEEINQNPTQANSASPGAQLLSAVLRTTGDRFEWWRANLIYSTTMVQHFAPGPSFDAGDRYTLNEGWSTSLFVRYNGYLRDVVDLIERTKDDPTQINVNSVARIWRAYIIHRVTDLYGDIPYSEASRGLLDDNFAPKYDTQQSIYTDMLKELTEAQAAFDANQSAIQGDVIYFSDLGKWAKFANSLRLRLAMRLSEIDAGTAQAEVNAAIQAGVMTSNSDLAMTPHDGDLSSNGSYSAFVDDASMHWFISETMVNYLQSTSDPRLGVIGAKYSEPKGNIVDADPANAQGLANGSDGPDDAENFTRYNFGMYGFKGNPHIHLTYAEVEFLLAEAAVRGWGATDAASHYENGIRAAMALVADGSFYTRNQNVISTTEIDDYLVANPFDNSSTENSLSQIHNQMWVTFFTITDGIEAYSNYRRTGHPALVSVNHPDNQTNGLIPTRLTYPVSESVLNAVNYVEAVNRLGGQNTLTGKVWWDAN